MRNSVQIFVSER